MGKALVIKNANFSTNKLATDVFSEAIPCTGISLSDSTANMTVIGSTKSLTATLTPSNTTDDVSWTSSNTDVATVNNGVVTQVGVGTATITATCGTQTAACVITAVNTLSFDYVIGRYNHKADATGADYVYNESGNQAYAAISSESVETTKRIRRTEPLTYPILLGKGATTITATVPNSTRITAWFTDSKNACDYSIDNPTFDYLAKVISGDASAYDSDVPLGNRTITVPEGADSIAMSLQYPGGTITDEIMAGISIVVS